MGFTKLFSDILCSSVWNEDDKTRIVWITLLAMRGPNNVSRGSIDGLAHQARVSIQDCENAVQKLSSPDRYSGDPEFDGRRIEKVDHGWLILNGEKYRLRRDDEDRKEYMATYMRQYRSNQTLLLRQRIRKQSVNNSKQCKQSLTDVNNVSPSESDQNRIRSESEEDKKREEEKGSTEGTSMKPSATPSERQSVSHILEELRPLYPGVDMEAQHRKMKAWQTIPKNSKRQFTRKFIVNWLNKIDIPIDVPKKKSGPMPLSTPLTENNGELPTEETREAFRKVMAEARSIANKRIP